MDSEVDVSICLVTHNGKDVLEKCLASLEAQGYSLRKEILVVDNASTDGTAEWVRGCFPEVRLSVNERNEYFTRPYNQMGSMARGRYLLILNNDVQFLDDALEQLFTFIETHPDVGAVGPLSEDPSGSIEAICRREYTFCGLLLEFSFLGNLLKKKSAEWSRYRLYDYDFRGLRPVDVLQDSCLLLRREMVATIGLYDDKYKLYFTEDDLCRRIRQQGWKIFYLPKVKVVHVHSYTSRRLSPFLVKWIYVHDMLHYARKHFGRWRTNLILRPLVYVSLGVRFAAGVWWKTKRG